MNKLVFSFDKRQRMWLGGLLVVFVATVFFFGQLGSVPPGLNGDAAAKGWHALKWLRGGVFPFWIPHASAPEPLIVWLQAMMVALLGPTAIALISVSAGAMVTAALAAYLLTLEAGQTLDDTRRQWAALFAGLGFASNALVSELGRSGLRATLLPSFVGFMLWALLLALRTGRYRHFVLAGILLGGMAYTYLAARLFPLALALFFGAVWLFQPARRACWRGIGVMLGIAAVVVLPQLVFFARFPGTFAQRAEATGLVNNSLYPQLGLWGVIAHKLWGLALMFGVQWQGQYNVSGHPILQPLAFAGFLLAVPLLIRRWREPGLLALAITLPVMLLPDLIAGDRPGPHELRVIGVLVPTQVLSGLGLGWALQKLAAMRWSSLMLYLAPGLAVVLIAWGFTDWYGSTAPQLVVSNYGPYQRPEVAEADFINATNAPILLPLSEYSRTTVAFLTSQRVHRVRGGLDLTGRVHHPATEQVKMIWPVDLAPVRPEGISYRHDPATLVLIDGNEAWLMPPADPAWLTALEQFNGEPITTPTGDLAARAYNVPFALFGFPKETRPAWEVDQTFDGRLRLWGVSVDHAIITPGELLGVTSFWQPSGPTRQNFRYYVHLVDNTGQLRDTEDAMPGYITYETNMWRAGETIPLRQLVQVPYDLLPGRYWVEVGFYDQLSGQRPLITDSSGQPADSHLFGPLKIPLNGPKTLEDETALEAQLADEFALRGYRVRKADNTRIEVALRLEALSHPKYDYTFFVHLDSPTTKTAAQMDAMPLDGAYPTSIWDPGETVVTNLVITLPPDFPAGDYTLWMGAYYLATGERLPLHTKDRELDDNRLLLQTITISQ